jgi:Mg/Co/Ni transporter MgtE
MITIDTDLVYSTKYYALNTRRKNVKAYESVDSYPEDYASKTTVDTDNNVNSQEINTGDIDLDALLKELKLYLPANRFSLLLQMKHEDLYNLLYLLDNEKLAMGLKFFKKEKIMDYMMSLPKDDILKVIFELFSREELLKTIPIKDLKNFFNSSIIQPDEIINVLGELPQNVLAQLYEATTGEAAGKMEPEQFMEKFKQMDPKHIMEGFKTLPYKEMLNVVDKFTENNPKLLKLFSAQTLCRPLEQSAKSRIIEGMKVLDPALLIKLVGQLPDKLLANINTMVDPEKFIEYMMKFNKNLLYSAVK